MSLSYPLALPSNVSRNARAFSLDVQPMAGVQRSPFTGTITVYDWGQAYWILKFLLPPLKRADAESWLAWRDGLYGPVGSFLAGRFGTALAANRGSWAGQTVKFNGANAVGAKSISVKNLTAASTWKAGDLLQQGSSGTSRLHRVTQDGTADGSGVGTVEITPPLRAAAADGDTITIASPKGLFMLSGGEPWTLEKLIYTGLTVEAVEDLRGI